MTSTKTDKRSYDEQVTTPTPATRKNAKDAALQRQRWERYSRWARRVGSTLGGRVERRIERHLLQRAWSYTPAERLQDYLVRGYQNPVINVQSMLAGTRSSVRSTRTSTTG